MSFSCECCDLLGIGLCDGPITHPEKSYQVWCVLRQVSILHATHQLVSEQRVN